MVYLIQFCICSLHISKTKCFNNIFCFNMFLNIYLNISKTKQGKVYLFGNVISFYYWYSYLSIPKSMFEYRLKRTRHLTLREENSFPVSTFSLGSCFYVCLLNISVCLSVFLSLHSYSCLSACLSLFILSLSLLVISLSFSLPLNICG